MTPAEADYLTLATLRTFGGKLAHAVEVTGAPAQLNLAIDVVPPEGMGTIGGSDLVITPINLWVVNRALASGGEPAIESLPVEPAEWRSKTEVGVSRQNAAQMIPSVERAIARVSRRVFQRERAGT